MTSALPDLPEKAQPEGTDGPKSPLDPRLDILFESEHLLVVNKPADLACHPTKTDAWSSLAGRIRIHLGPESKIRLVHRLDRETSGAIVAAKTVEAARELGSIWEKGEVRKSYLAVTHGSCRENAGTITAPLGPDPLSIIAIKDCVRPDGSAATTHWQKLGDWVFDSKPFSLLRVTPETGRKHQIRIHLAFKGLPIVGDKIYGGNEQCYLDLVAGQLSQAQRAQLMLPCQGLHARTLQFVWRSRQYDFHAAPERWFLEFIPQSLHERLR